MVIMNFKFVKVFHTEFQQYLSKGFRDTQKIPLMALFKVDSIMENDSFLKIFPVSLCIRFQKSL